MPFVDQFSDTYADTYGVQSGGPPPPPGTVAYVRFKPPLLTNFIQVPSLTQPGHYGIPTGTTGGVTTVAVPSLKQSSVYTKPVLSSAVVTGYIIPDRHTATDPNVKITPYTGGDKKACPDSTAGIQAFLDNETPNGATVYLTFDVRVDGTLQLRGNRTLRSPNINAPSRIFRALIFPWRVVPDLRATVGGNPNPWYNPNGRCSQWQYDWRGGQATIGTNFQAWDNPYGMNPSTGADKGSGDGNGGFDCFDEAWLVNTDGAGKAQPNPNYDGKHLTALQAITVAGKNWTAYPAGAIWFNSDVGKKIRILYNAGASGVFQTTIASVDAGGRTVRWNTASTGKSLYVNWTLQWAISPFDGCGWIVQMISNPNYNPLYVNGGMRPVRPDNYDFAMSKCVGQRNQNEIINMAAGTTLLGIEVVGTNNDTGTGQTGISAATDLPCRNALLNWNTANPMQQEFGHLVATDGASPPTCKIDHCSIHHAWGDAQVGNMIATDSRFSSTGRQGCTTYWDGISIDNCTFEDHKHSCFDMESPGTTHNVMKFTNNCLGGPHGGSISTALNNLTYTGNHSIQADITSGRIQSLCNPMRSTNWGRGVDGNSGGQNWVINNNNFDKVVNSNSPPSWTLVAVDGLTMRNNRGPMVGGTHTNYFLQPEYVVGNPAGRCTNMTLSGNDGGSQMIGTGGNDSINPA